MVMAHLLEADELTLKDIQEIEKSPLRKLPRRRQIKMTLPDLVASRNCEPSLAIDYVRRSRVAAHTRAQENRASVRYWIWFAASVKFLIPFSLLGQPSEINLHGTRHQ